MDEGCSQIYIYICFWGIESTARLFGGKRLRRRGCTLGGPGKSEGAEQGIKPMGRKEREKTRSGPRAKGVSATTATRGQGRSGRATSLAQKGRDAEEMRRHEPAATRATNAIWRIAQEAIYIMLPRFP